MIINKSSTYHRIQAVFIFLVSVCVLLSSCSQPQSDSTSEEWPTAAKAGEVILDKKLDNGYRKQIERLTDGGKRVTITNSKQEIILQQLEYEGIVEAVNGNELTVQVEGGGQQTFTVPSNVVIEDEDGHGLKKGVEIEWVVDADGQLQSVELEE